jgi:hypothetical protein
MNGQPIAKPTLYRIRFAEQAPADQTVLMEFRDPAPRFALQMCNVLETPPTGQEAQEPDILEVVAVPGADQRWRNDLQNWVAQAAPRSAVPPVTIKVREAQVTWCSGRAVIQGGIDHIDPLLAALADFHYYEAELRRLELEVAASWRELEEDSPLAYDVKQSDMTRYKEVGRRVEQTLRRRMRHVRIEPHLYEPSAHLPAAAQDLGERLREETRIEDRLEILDGQIEAFESVYEMCSQRIGEFRAAREGFVLESVIIVLLTVETVLLLAELIWCLEY